MASSGRRRVVITGLGAVTPLGNDVRSSWENLVAGAATADTITAFDASGFPVTFACEAKGFEPTQWIERKQARRMDRFAQMIVAAARQAQADAGLEIEPECDRVGVSFGTAMGGLRSFEDTCDTLLERGPDRVNPFSLTAIIPNMGASRVSIELGTKGPLSAQCTACAASTMAIGDGLDAIRFGRADVMFAGGSEAPITPVGIAGFSALRALSRRNDDVEHASRPFDADRDGFVMGEAGAALVLEELGHANTARRADLRRARWLRRLLRRAASDRARPDGPEPSSGHAHGVRGCWRLTRPGRLHQRARHLDSARRRERDAGHQTRPRRSRRPDGPDLIDQGRDRAPPRCRGRGRGGLLHARDPREVWCLRPSTTRRPIPSAISTMSRTKRAKPMWASPSRTRPDSAGITRRLCSVASRDR